MPVEPEVLRKVLKHPLVTYITIIPKSIILTNHSISTINNPQVFMLLNYQELEFFLKKWRIRFENINIEWDKEIPMAAINYTILDMKYRYLQVSIFGNTKPKQFYLFTVPKNDYYQDKIYFALFDQEGDRIPVSSYVYDLKKLQKK